MKVTIGDRFKTKPLKGLNAEVVDIYTVTNSKGEFVRNIVMARLTDSFATNLFEVPKATVIRHKLK